MQLLRAKQKNIKANVARLSIFVVRFLIDRQKIAIMLAKLPYRNGKSGLYLIKIDMEEIYRYAADHSSRASEALAWLEKQTNIRTSHARMLSGSVQGELLRLTVLMSGASHILELGTFTGYSAICLASALPEGGILDTLELNDELEDLIHEGFARAGLEDRIRLHIGDCRELLAAMPSDRIYDLIYIDANKRDYCEYYDLVFPHLKTGGWILADNVLWDGKVCAEKPSADRQTQGILRFNEMVASDPRVENVILPIRDGLNIIRKIV